MRENFEAAIRFTCGAGIEGGYVNDPDDKGGPTNHGITQRTLSLYLRRPATIKEVQTLSLATAKDIYLRFYWQPAGCDVLPAGVDVMLFDIAVNSGLGKAHEFANQTSMLKPGARIEQIHKMRLTWWQHLSKWWKYGKGWTHREDLCHALCLKLALAGADRRVP